MILILQCGTHEFSKETNDKRFEKRIQVDEFDEVCYLVQENNSLEVTLESHLYDCTNSSNDHDSSKDVML